MENTNKVLKLPSNFNEMESYIIENKLILTEHVIDCIEHAVETNKDSIDIFNFNNRSGFYVKLKKDMFLENVKNIYDFYMEEELYEKCSRVVDLQSKIKKSYI